MKYALSLLGVFIVTAISTLIAQASKHPALFLTGVIIGGFILLALAVYLTKKFWGMIGWSLSSALFILAALVTIGLLSYFNVIPAIAGFGAGTFLGAALSLLGIRQLAKKAHVSVFFGEIFAWISAYKIRSYVEHRNIIDRDKKLTEGEDSKNLALILTDQWEFTKAEAKEAIAHIKEKMPYATMEEKVIEALAFLDDVKKTGG